MPILHWLNREQSLKEASRVPYRLLEADPDLSYGDLNTENMLIQGDNLEALKALLPYYAGKVKCIFIDPPYNTKSAFEHYDDNLEHTKWLEMMYPRLELLRELLAEDGSIFIQIDDYESDYLKIILDEVFGRNNYRNRFYVSRTIKTNNSQFEKFKSYNNAVEYILCYAKSDATLLNKILKPSSDKKHTEGQWKTFYQGDDRKTMQYEILGESLSSGHWIWNKQRAFEAVQNYKIYEEYCKNNSVITIKEYWELKDCQEEYIQKVSNSKAKDKGLRYWIPPKGGILLTNNWTDTLTYANNGFFPTAKSEKVLQLVMSIATKPNDLVLDSFLGSGTTAAVAHKMGRRYIGIEIGNHAITHCLPRLQKVIEGEQGGISKALHWQGGGGVRFYRLGQPIFDEAGHITANIAFKHLAAHIWFSETRTPLQPKGTQNDTPKSPLLGVHNGVAYYLLYNGILGDKRPQGGNVLTTKILATLPPHAGAKVIYGETSRLGAGRLAEHHITFKQTPYDVKAR
jgi:adenine-specific DNA-methyltransferase